MSGLYILSLAYVANFLIEAHRSGRTDLFLLTVAVYAVSSAIGSTLGQMWALRFEKSHGIKH